MSNDYTLPPLPIACEGWSVPAQSELRTYGHACAEHVRAPLLARIAELEAELAQVSGYCETLTQRCVDDTAENGRLRAEVEALRAKIDHAEVPPKGKPEFLEWVATELAKGEALDWVVAQGIAATLRGQAYLLRAVAAQAQAQAKGE